MILGNQAFAASDTWKAAPTSGNWNTGGNWVGGSNPGTGTNPDTAGNTDIATFNSTSTFQAVNLASGRNMGGLLFDTAAVGAYTITTTNGSFFYFTRGGITQMTSSVANAQDLSGAPIRITAGITGANSIYTFQNNATLSSATMTLGQIRNAAGVAATLILDGSNTGANTVSGNLLEAAGTQPFSILKQGAGTWVLSGTGNAYTGGTTVNAGTLTVSATSSLGAATNSLAVNNPNVGVGTAVTVNLNSSQTVGSLSGAVATPTAGANSATINLLGASTTLTINQSTNTTYAGTLAGTLGNLTKTGAGILTLTGANTHGGFTTVSGGTLALANVGGGGAAQGSSNIIVNTGGTVLLGAANQILDSATITGGGGTLNTGGFSDAVGQLFMNAGMTLDLGNGASVMQFAAFATSTGILSILNWTGNLVVGGGTDQVHFGTLLSPAISAGQLSQIQFVNPNGLTGIYSAALGADLSEVVPGALVAVPEPSTVAAGALLLGALGWHQRRRFPTRRGTAKA